MGPNPADRFGADLDTLRDQLIEAVRLRRLAVLADGLAVLERLGEAILHRVKMIDDAMGDRRKEVSWRRELGLGVAADRLTPLSQALWPVIEEAIVTGDAQLTWQIFRTANALARTAHAMGDHASFNDVLVLYPRAAYRLHTVDSGRASLMGVPDLTRSLLTLAQTISLSSRRDASEDAVSYLAPVLEKAWELARLLIDQSDREGLARWASAYEESLAMSLSGEDRTARALAILNQLGALALRGWILLSWHEDWRPLTEAEAAGLYIALQDMGEPELTWEAVAEDDEERLSEGLGLDWWESTSRPAGRAYWMRFGTYRDDAAALTMLDRPEARRGIPLRHDLTEVELSKLKRQGETARRLREAVERLDKYEPLRTGVPADRAKLLERLNDILGELEARKTRELIEQSLDSERVETFYSAVISGVGRQGSISGVFPRCDGVTAAESGDEPPPLFGTHSLAPKEFFVSTDVHADPSSLGQSIASSILRGEDRLVTERLSKACRSEPLGDRRIEVVVPHLVGGFRDPAEIHVLVVGVLDWWVQLRRSMNQDMGVRFNDSFSQEGVTYSQHHAGDWRGVLVADLPRLACYSRVVADSDDRKAEGLALLSVDAISATEAREMADAQGNDLEKEDLAHEVRRLQQQVRLRAFVRPHFRILDAAAGRIILPSSDDG